MRVKSSARHTHEASDEKGVPYEKTITFEPSQWTEIEKLNLTSLRSMCRTHGFQFENKSGDSKAKRKERFLNTLRSHLRGIHGWDV